MEIKKGNYMNLVIGPILDYNKAVVTNLATASAVRFSLKENKKDIDADAVLLKTLGAGVTVNSPSTGYVTVTINSADTEILDFEGDEIKYFLALQIKYSSANDQEIDIKEKGKLIETITVKQDIIRKSA